MKFLNGMLKKAGKTASDGAIENVKSRAVDILPRVLRIGGLVLGAIIISKTLSDDKKEDGNCVCRITYCEEYWK